MFEPKGKSHRDHDDGPSSDAAAVKGAFIKDLEIMMYGYGDHPSPLPQTVEVLEDIVIGYLTDLIYKSMDAAALRGKLRQGGQKVGLNALVVDDVLHNVRKDPKKYGRVQELLILQEEIKKAKQILADEDAK